MFNFAKGTFKVFYECAKFIKKNPGRVFVAGLLIFSPGAMASNVIQLNEHDPFSSSFPHSVFLTSNTTAASWIGATSGGSVSGFSTRSYGIDGPITGEINSQVIANQAFFTAPPIRNSEDEIFQVYTGSPSDIIAGRGYFLTNGTASTPIQPISSSGRGFRPDTTTDSLGLRHTVVWFNPDTDEVYGQVVNAAGETQLILDALLFSNATNPDHARFPNGQLVVVSETLDGGSVARRFDTSFNPLSQQVLVSSLATLPSVGALDDNGVIAVYEQDDQIVGQMLDQGLSPQTMEVQISGLNSTNNMNPMVGILPDTLFETFPEQTAFILWTRRNASNTDVYARLMTRNLIALSEEFILNEDQVGFHGFPSLSVSSDGLVFATWQNSTQSSFGRFLNQTFLRSLIGEFPSTTSSTSETTEGFDPNAGNDDTPLIAGVATGVTLCVFSVCCCTNLGISYCLLHRDHKEQTHHPVNHSDSNETIIPIHMSEQRAPSLFDPQNTGYTEGRLTFEGNLTRKTYVLLDQVSEDEAREFQPDLAKPIEPEGSEEKSVFEKQKKKKNLLKDPRFDFHIDKGNFGTLYLGLTENQKVAIKVVTGKGIEDSLTEGELMNSVPPHKNVMRLLDFRHNKPERGIETLNQVMELAYCNGDYLAKMLTAFPPKERVEFIGDAFAQIMAGLTHLHQTVEHHDMKLANLLVFLNGGIKIGDFGKAKLKSLSISNPLELGDVRKLAPEATALLRDKAPEQVMGERVKTVQGSKLDTFATGLSVIEAFGDNPEFYSYRVFSAQTRVSKWTYQVFNKHIQGGLDVIPSEAPFLSTLKLCLEVNPTNRISSEEAANQLATLLWPDNYREARFVQLLKGFQSQASKTHGLPKMSRDQLYQKPSDVVYASRQIESLYPQRVEHKKDELYHQPTEGAYGNQPTDSDRQFIDQELQLPDTYNNE